MSGYNFKYKIIYPIDILNFKKPNEVYIEVDYNHSIIIPKKNDYIYKGMIIAHNKGEIKKYIYSPISGEVIDICDKIDENGNIVKCIIIENDFKENTEDRKGIKENIYDYDKNSFIELLRSSGLGNNNPLYLNYSISPINYLIVNAYECLPYVKHNSSILYTYIKEILKTIDVLSEINKIETIYLIVNKNDYNLIDKIKEYIGTYLNIKLITVNINYPYDSNEYILNNILHINKGYIINNIEEIYNIYELLQKKKVSNYKFVYIDGLVKKPILLKVKIGTPIKELINVLQLKDNNIMLANNPLNGNTIDIDNSMVTNRLDNIIILNDHSNKCSSNCINCGKCIKYCPYNIYPLGNNIKKCDRCGICSYICPAKIDFNNILKEKLNELPKE